MKKSDKDRLKKINQNPLNVLNMNDRTLLWSQMKMIKEIEFFTKGKKISIPEAYYKLQGMSFSQKLDKLKLALKSARNRRSVYCRRGI